MTRKHIFSLIVKKIIHIFYISNSSFEIESNVMSDKSVFITEYKSKHNNDINNESDE